MLKNIFIVGCAALAIAGIPAYMDKLGNGPDLDAAATNSPEADAPMSGKVMSLNVQEPAKANYVTGVRKAQIPVAASGHFEAEFRINGRVVRGMIDTGATVIAINRSTAQRIGISPSNAEFTFQATTANGIARAARVQLSRVEIGMIEVRDVTAFVMDDAALTDTLIGMSFMSKLAGYKVEGQTLILEN